MINGFLTSSQIGHIPVNSKVLAIQNFKKDDSDDHEFKDEDNNYDVAQKMRMIN